MSDELAIRPVGDRCLLVELGGLDAVLALHDELAAHPRPGQQEVLAAAATVLVRTDSPAAARALARDVASLDLAGRAERDDNTLVEVEVCYDGEDLEAVAGLLRMSPQALVAAHSGQPWIAAFGGFAPGFTYCVAGEHPFDVPRRPTPRTAVPAGSVGLAGRFSAAYPRTTPGGWQLIGRTAAPLWSPDSARPALIAPGNTVSYRPVRATARLVPVRPPRPRWAGRGVEVIAAGPQSLATDLGRPGHAELGVAESGAMDRGSARLANAVVGNPPDASLVENLAGGLVVRAVGHQTAAVAGARVPLRVDPPEGSAGRPWAPALNNPIALPDGATLRLGAPTAGLRAYLAIRGGLDLPRTLGSAATDVMSGEGPAPLRAGDRVPVGVARWNVVGRAGADATALPLGGAPVVVRLRPGPRDDWFDAGALACLLGQEWRVGGRSNRIGVRLEGTPLRRSRQGELTSEGTVAGAVQVPTGGQPVVLMRDHPVTGGYPVIGVVESADLDAVAQVPPGAALRFAAV